MATQAKERGTLIRKSTPQSMRKDCRTCTPPPVEHVSAEDLWVRTMKAPTGYQVRVTPT